MRYAYRLIVRRSVGIRMLVGCNKLLYYLNTHQSLGLLRRVIPSNSEQALKCFHFLTLVRSHLVHCGQIGTSCLIQDSKLVVSLQGKLLNSFQTTISLTTNPDFNNSITCTSPHFVVGISQCHVPNYCSILGKHPHLGKCPPPHIQPHKCKCSFAR